MEQTTFETGMLEEKKIERKSIDPNKLKAIEIAMQGIEKQFGKGSVMKLSDNKGKDVAAISTGNISLDLALGIGGVPRGRIIEIYGPESSGKTTIATHIMAQVQAGGEIAAMIDAEHAFDPVYAASIGVDTENLIISQPDTGEQALEITEALIRSGAVNVIVIDSVAALVPKAEIEGNMGDSHVGLQARLMSQALRKITGIANQNDCTLIFINQLREKVGVLFGNPETTPGGRALKFYSTIRLDIRRGEQIKQGDSIIGNKTNIKVVKNKVAPPFKTASVDIMYGKGVSKSGEIIDIGSSIDIVEKSGAWYSYKGEKIGQGRENAKLYLENNPKVSEEIEHQIRQHFELEPKK